MKRFLTLGIASILTLGITTGCLSAAAASNDPNTVQFDFEEDDASFKPICRLP